MLNLTVPSLVYYNQFKLINSASKFTNFCLVAKLI